VRAGGVDEADAAGVRGEGAWRGTGVGGAGDGGEGLVEGLFQGAGFRVEGGAGLGVSYCVLGRPGEVEG
jgi:hypothetical protein